MSKRPVERRPGVFIFEQRMPRRERIRWTIGCSVTMVVLLAASGLFLILPGISDEVRADLSPGCFVFSWLPLFFIVMTWIAPQQALRVSSNGIWYAQTRWQRVRRSMRWREVARVRWATPITLEVATGMRVTFPTARHGRAVCRALKPILSQWFDLSGGTAEQQRHEEMARWSIVRRVTDKALLIGIALWLVLFPLGGVLIGSNRLTWPAILYLLTWVSITCGGIIALARRRLARGWLNRKT